MTFDKNFILPQMADTARRQFELNKNRLDSVDEQLSIQMRGQSMPRLIIGTVGTALWAAAYIFLFITVMSMEESTLAIISLVLSLILLVLCFVDRFSRIRYFGSISQTRSRIGQMRSRLDNSERALSSEVQIFSDCRTTGWSEALNPGESIPEELDQIELAITNMATMQSGFLQKAKLILYYIVALGWAVAGSLAMEGLLYSLLGDDFSSGTIHVMLIIGTILTAIVEIFVARLMSSMTNFSVTNVTLFATCAGPVIFALLAVVTSLAISLVALVFKLIAGLIALFIGGSIVFGMCSGG